MKISKIIIVTYGFFFIFFPYSGYAWGIVGQKVIAYIAQDNLSENAKTQLELIMEPESDFRSMGKIYFDLSSLSNDSDLTTRLATDNSGSSDFMLLPLRRKITKHDVSDYCLRHNCLVKKLRTYEEILGNKHARHDDRLRALGFVVNLVSDLHQPIDCIDDSDFENVDNEIDENIGLRKSKMKLRTLWDNLIEIENGEQPRKLADKLELAITSKKRDEWSEGNEIDWTFESYMLAKSIIYPDLRFGSKDHAVYLPPNYYAQMSSVVDGQLEKAGIRLAAFLNNILNSQK